MGINECKALAKMGNADAQYALANHYIEIRKNAAGIVKWLTKAADQGHPEAQTQLGFFYYQGHNICGLQTDHDKAEALFIKAAAQGHDEAKYRLASLYSDGGEKQDILKAAQLFNDLATKGDNVALRDLFRLHGYLIARQDDKLLRQVYEACMRPISWLKPAGDTHKPG